MRGGWWVEASGWRRRIGGLPILLELAISTVEDSKIPFIEFDMFTGAIEPSRTTGSQRPFKQSRCRPSKRCQRGQSAYAEPQAYTCASSPTQASRNKSQCRIVGCKCWSVKRKPAQCLLARPAWSSYLTSIRRCPHENAAVDRNFALSLFSSAFWNLQTTRLSCMLQVCHHGSSRIGCCSRCRCARKLLGSKDKSNSTSHIIRLVK